MWWQQGSQQDGCCQCALVGPLKLCRCHKLQPYQGCMEAFCPPVQLLMLGQRQLLEIEHQPLCQVTEDDDDRPARIPAQHMSVMAFISCSWCWRLAVAAGAAQAYSKMQLTPNTTTTLHSTMPHCLACAHTAFASMHTTKPLWHDYVGMAEMANWSL